MPGLMSGSEHVMLLGITRRITLEYFFSDKIAIQSLIIHEI